MDVPVTMWTSCIADGGRDGAMHVKIRNELSEHSTQDIIGLAHFRRVDQR